MSAASQLQRTREARGTWLDKGQVSKAQHEARDPLSSPVMLEVSLYLLWLTCPLPPHVLVGSF